MSFPILELFVLLFKTGEANFIDSGKMIRLICTELSLVSIPVLSKGRGFVTLLS